MSNDVFVSYSHKDKVVADAIVNHLESSNIRCWYAPRDILTGQVWADSIVNAINASKVMVLIFTDFANESVQVRREVDNAISHGLTIVPFKLTQEPPKGAMEYYLSTLHWLDAMNEPLEDAIAKLSSRIAAILENRENPNEQTPNKAVNNDKNTAITGKKRILIGAISVIFFAFALLLIASALITLGDDFGGGSITFALGLLFGIPSFAGLVMTVEKRKLSNKALTVTGILTVLSLILIIYITVKFL